MSTELAVDRGPRTPNDGGLQLQLSNAIVAVYKRRLGPWQKDPKKRSKHEDGLIGWRKMPIRAQETMIRCCGGIGVLPLAPLAAVEDAIARCQRAGHIRAHRPGAGSHSHSVSPVLLGASRAPVPDRPMPASTRIDAMITPAWHTATTVRVRSGPLGTGLPGIDITATAIAAMEPGPESS